MLNILFSFFKYMKTKKSAIEFEKVITIIIVLVVLAFLLFLFAKYGGSTYQGLKQQVGNILSLTNQSMLKSR